MKTKSTKKRLDELEKNINLILAHLNLQPKQTPTLKQKPTPKKKLQEANINPEIKEIIDFWNANGLRQHKAPNSKLYKDIVKKIKSLKDGSFFDKINGYEIYKNKKFTKEEIFSCIQKFSLSALSDDYMPIGNYKQYLAKLSLADFLYNSKSENTRSYFIKFFQEEPKLASTNFSKSEEDKFPNVSKALSIIYRNEILGGVKTEFTNNEKNSFIKASNRLMDFIKTNQRKINDLIISGVSGNRNVELAKLLFNSVVFDLGENQMSKITPGYLCSDLTFSKRFPAYLQNQGIILRRE